MDKIKQLLESKSYDDVAIGLVLLIKKNKPRTNFHMNDLLKDIKFSMSNHVDFYISYFNVYITATGSVRVFSIREKPATRDDTIIRL